MKLNDAYVEVPAYDDSVVESGRELYGRVEETYNRSWERAKGRILQRYRILVEWMLLSMERNNLYTAKAYSPVEPHLRDVTCPWLVKEVNRRGHDVTTYDMAFNVIPCHKDGREITESEGECLCENRSILVESERYGTW